MKVVINKCYGGFSISKEAMELLGVDSPYPDIKRNDPALVEVVEKLGDKANGSFSKLKIVEIPDDVEWDIAEYDGLEWVEEVHRTWS